MNTQKDIIDTIHAFGVIPLTALDTVQDGLEVCEVLCRNGLPILEVTFRTAAAATTIRRAATEFPNMAIGAGTVLTVDDVQKAHDSGAKFAVSPGFNPKIVKRAMDIGLPFFPGVCTPTNIEQALDMGLTVLKYFPAEAAGGIPMLKAMCAPYKHKGVRFMPTGGISAANMGDYLAIPEVVAIGGSWIASKKLVEAKDWATMANEITAAKAAVIAARA